jgi:hypothetical protein
MTRRSSCVFAQEVLLSVASRMCECPFAHCSRPRSLVLASSSCAQMIIILRICWGCGMHFGSLTMARKLWCPLLPGYGCLLLMVYDRLSLPCCACKAQVHLFLDPDRFSCCISNASRCSIDGFDEIRGSLRCGDSTEIRRKAEFSLS